MERIMISVMVPSMNKCFDISLPCDLIIEKVIELLVKAIENVVEESYYSSKEELLCWHEKSIVLNRKKTLLDYGIQNGDILYMY